MEQRNDTLTAGPYKALAVGSPSYPARNRPSAALKFQQKGPEYQSRPSGYQMQICGISQLYQELDETGPWCKFKGPI